MVAARSGVRDILVDYAKARCEENREKLGPVFLCIQDFRKIAETAAKLVIRQLSGTDEPARIITIPPAEFLRF